MKITRSGSIAPLLIGSFIFCLTVELPRGFDRRTSQAQAQAQGPSVAILGDSISTGAASHPQLTLSRKNLWDIFLKPESVTPRAADLPQDLPWKYQDPLGHPVSSWPTWRELHAGVDYTFLVLVNAISQNLLNTEEYSWGNQLAQGLGIPASQVTIAAENGAKIANLNRQVDRLVATRQGTLPHKVFVFFTGNDICGPTVSMMTSPEDFASALSGGLSYLARFQAPPGGSDIYVVAYLNVTQIVTNPSILEKKVFAFGETTTCQALHKQYFTPTADQAKNGKDVITPPDPSIASPLPPWFLWFFNTLMPPSPAGMCPNLFANSSAETLSAVANRIRSYRQKSEEVVATFQKEPTPSPNSLRFHWLPTPASIGFEGADIAGDCFHLSPKGQGKLALDLAKTLGTVPK